MYKVTYYIGKFDKNTNKQELANEYFVSTITKLLNECTIIRSKSVYINSKNKQIHEPSLVVIKFTNDIDDLALNTKYFKRWFNQESILVTVEDVKVEVY